MNYINIKINEWIWKKDVYVSPLIKLTDLVNQRIDIKLEDQKYSQTLYVIVLTFLEDITRYYRAHGSDLNEKQKLIMCEKIEYIINTICGKLYKKNFFYILFIYIYI